MLDSLLELNPEYRTTDLLLLAQKAGRLPRNVKAAITYRLMEKRILVEVSQALNEIRNKTAEKKKEIAKKRWHQQEIL